MTLTNIRPPESIDSIFDGNPGERNPEEVQAVRSDDETTDVVETITPTKSGRLAGIRIAAVAIAASLRSRIHPGSAEGSEASAAKASTPEEEIKAWMESRSGFFEAHPELAAIITKMEISQADAVCAEAERLSIILPMKDFAEQPRREEIERGTVATHIARRMLEQPKLTEKGAKDFSRAVALAGRGTVFNYKLNNDFGPKDPRKFISDRPTQESIAEIDVFTHIASVEARLKVRGLKDDMEFLVDTHRLLFLAQGMEALAIAVTDELPNEALTTQTIKAMKKLQSESTALAIALYETHYKAIIWHEETASKISEAKARRILFAEIKDNESEIVDVLLSMPPLQAGTLENQPALVTDYDAVNAAFTRYAERAGIKLHPEIVDELQVVMEAQPAVTVGISELAASLNALIEQGKIKGLTKEHVYELMGALYAASTIKTEGGYEVGKFPDLELLNGLRALMLAERVTVSGGPENPLLVLHPESEEWTIEMFASDRDPKLIEEARRACALYVIKRLENMTYPGTITNREGVFNLNLDRTRTLSGIDLANATKEKMPEPNEVESAETES